ncbi:MAG: alpha/beta hydrolase [Anaerolineae bacterium]|nr:alpha/beta hydrolase [Anaerolineae bacterium]
MLQEKSFNTGEVVLNYAEGPKSGSPMVLLHGGSVSWENLQPLLPTFIEHWHVFALDLRGHGKSGRPAEESYHATDYARDVVAFLHQQVDQPAILIGHSLGGLAALATAPQVPDCISALILLDPPLFLRDLPLTTKPEIVQWLTFVYDMVSKAKSVEDIIEIARPFTPQGRPEAETRKNAERIFATAPGTIKTMLDNQVLEGFDIEMALHNIKCPTLLLSGEWDKGSVVRDEDAAYVRQQMPQVVVQKILNAGHQIHEDQTETVLQVITTFLERV